MPHGRGVGRPRASWPGARRGIIGSAPRGRRGESGAATGAPRGRGATGSTAQARIAVDRERLAAFCRRHHIRRPALFGSVLRDDLRPDSDVDVLVEFAPHHTVGLTRLAGTERELSGLLGRGVDLRTPADLSPYFRQEVPDSADAPYAAG